MNRRKILVKRVHPTDNLDEFYAITRITSYAEWYTQYKAEHGVLTFFQWLKEMGYLYRTEMM